jgi:hypothetical protein
MKTREMLISLILLCLFPAGILQAQTPSRQRLEAQRVAFITEKLQLTPEEAQQFWPVYNEYRRKKMKLEKEKTDLVRGYSSRESTLTDQEAEKIADEYVQLEKKQADLLVEYNARFKKVLPPKKVLQLYKAEKQFTAFLLRQIRDRQRRDGPPPRKY